VRVSCAMSSSGDSDMDFCAHSELLGVLSVFSLLTTIGGVGQYPVTTSSIVSSLVLAPLDRMVHARTVPLLVSPSSSGCSFSPERTYAESAAGTDELAVLTWCRTSRYI
jgi:hypothetical protein